VSRRFDDQHLGLGAGMMLAAATLDLLSTALHEVRTGAGLDLGRFGLVLAGFASGVALLYLTLWKLELAAKSSRMQVRRLRRAMLGEAAVRPLRRSAAPS